MVSSLVGAPVNGVGIVGIYPESVLRSWDAALGEGRQLATSDIVTGIVAAARRGPGVINLSLGGPDRDSLIEQAVSVAVHSGSLVVAASGNEGNDGSPPGYPAALPHVLTVGATSRSGAVAGFSTAVPLRRPRRARRRHDRGVGSAERLAPRRQRHELLVPTRRRRRGMGLDGATGPRQHPAVRSDAPLGEGHRHARPRPAQRLRRARCRSRPRVGRPDSRSARTERRRRVRPPRRLLRHRPGAADDADTRALLAHRTPRHDRGSPRPLPRLAARAAAPSASRSARPPTSTRPSGAVRP